MESPTFVGIFRDRKVEFTAAPPGLVDGTRVKVQPLAEEPPNAVEREALRQEAFAEMKAGLNLGGPPYPTRDEIYDRHGR
jgi:hypothetical protein